MFLSLLVRVKLNKLLIYRMNNQCYIFMVISTHTHRLSIHTYPFILNIIFLQ